MGAYADLLQELVDAVEAVTGLARFKGPMDGSGVPATALDGAFVVRFSGGADTDDQRGRSNVYDEHDAQITCWYQLDHNDRLATDKAALDDVIAIRNAIYPRDGTLTGTHVASFGYSMSAEGGGEVLRVEISTTLHHTTAVS
ncbi:MAG: hypothetical protein GY741_16385 [Phycisphaeraceae bacterium]|nr:hypothetical protein [Phycisphaeraceae bacterium]